MSNSILPEIEKFLRETGMSEATFQRKVGNGRLFERLRKVGKRGRPGRLWPESEKEIRTFMNKARSHQGESA